MASIGYQEHPSDERAAGAARAIRLVAIVTIGAMALGFVMQGLIVVLRLLDASVLTGAGKWAELAQTVSWGVLVCTGVAVGVSVGRGRAALAGLMGLVFAPLALAAAKGAQKVVLALVQAAEQPQLLSIETLGVIRALEYGLLAWLLALLVERKAEKPWLYIGSGAAVGLVFGGIAIVLSILAAQAAGTPQGPFQMARLAITEIGFPIGCALLIHVGQVIAVQSGRYQQAISQEGAGLP